MEELQKFVNRFGLGISKEELICEAYTAMLWKGHEVCIVNERYLEVDNRVYQLIKSKKQNKWIVKEV